MMRSLLALVQLALVLAMLPATANAASKPMLVASSTHFRIYANQAEADLRSFAEELETYDAVLRRLTGVVQEDADVVPLTIYVRSDENALDAGAGVLGYYLPTAAGAIAVVPQKIRYLGVAALPRQVLFHEYAHHFVLQNFATLYSPWFVEGIAEFYSTIEIEPDRVLVGKPPPLRTGTLLRRQRNSLKFLFAPPKGKALDGEQTDELYARAWLLVHYLTLSKERGGQINPYLRARSAGATEDQAFESVFHASIPAMDQEIKRYIAPRSLGYATLDRPKAGTVAIRSATDGETAMTRLVPRLRTLDAMRDALAAEKRSVSATQVFDHLAAKLASDARDAARKYPADAEVQEIVAQSLLLAGKREEAAAAASTAIALNPRAARAHLVLADAAISALAPGDSAGLVAARREIVAANRAAPNDPLPLIDYYQSYAKHGLKPTPTAIAGLARAQQLAPQDDQVRMLLATEEIGRRQYARAAELLRPVAFAPHPGPRRDAAQALMNTLPGVQEQAPPAVRDTEAAAPGPDKAIL